MEEPRLTAAFLKIERFRWAALHRQNLIPRIPPMKDSTKLWLVSLPFLLVGLAVVFTPLVRDYMARRREEAWKNDPLTMQITVSKATEASSPHRYESAGDVLFFEIGLLRLKMPVEGARGGGGSGGSRIATTSTGTGGGSSASGGGHQHSHRDVPYGSEHEFSGPGYYYKFDVRQGCFCIGDRRICIVDTPKLIALEFTGEIASVTELSVSHPPLKGSAGDVVALIDRAQKYAKVPPSEFSEEAWRMDPLQCQMQVKSVAEASSNSRLRGVGKEILFETALLRLVIPEGGIAGSSSSQSTTTIATPQAKDEVDSVVKSKSGSTATSPHAYRKWRAGCSTHHVISGPGYYFTFDIIQGCLCIKGQRVCIVDTPKLVILDQVGRIKSIRELTVEYPKPTGKAEDIAGLGKMGERFAERFKK